ncbi:hypothetical protein [Parvibium lacunae]|nr:hypothetical protein [Parvibium lacunae]
MLQQRPPTRTRPAHWRQSRERGSKYALLGLQYAMRYLGRPVLVLLLYPVGLYFFVTGQQARQASYDYLQRVNAVQPTERKTQVNWRLVLRHFYAFSWSVLDRLDAWSGNLTHADIEVVNPDVLQELIAQPQGALLLGAHIGNADVSRALYQTAASPYWLTRQDRSHTINALMHTEHAQQINQFITKLTAKFRENVFELTTIGPDTAIHWREKIEQGEWLFMLADRTPSEASPHFLQIDFLGTPARWPTGPFILAHVLECPVYSFFCIRTRDWSWRAKYRVYIERFSEKIELPRKQREQVLAGHLQRFVTIVEKHCLTTPLQWFNFFPFWK